MENLDNILERGGGGIRQYFVMKMLEWFCFYKYDMFYPQTVFLVMVTSISCL